MQLQGKDIKIGDKVWHITKGWVEIKALYESEYPVETDEGSYTSEGHLTLQGELNPTIYWEEMQITVKPVPVYEWQYVYKTNPETLWNITNNYYLNDEKAKAEFNCVVEIQKLEISKREVVQ